MSEGMEQAVANIRAGYEAFSRGDFDASAEFIHPDITWNRVVGVETALKGRDAVRANMEPDLFAEQHSEVLGAEVIGDCVLVNSSFRAKGAGSGIEMTDVAWQLWRIKDGMAIEFTHFTSRDDAVAAARL
jgi:ketosteroid isomerase-like protein